MARGLFAGATDYSRQSFDDMAIDLQNWIISLNEIISLFNNDINLLKKSGGWDSVNGDIQILFLQALQFYETSHKEIGEILAGIQTEVQFHHISRLRSLSTTADKLNRLFPTIRFRLWYTEELP